MTHKTGNEKLRAPIAVVTRAMAEAGKAKMATMVGLCDEGATDDQLVSEVFLAMWAVYWEQVYALQGKQVKPPHNLILPPSGIVRQ